MFAKFKANCLKFILISKKCKYKRLLFLDVIIRLFIFAGFVWIQNDVLRGPHGMLRLVASQWSSLRTALKTADAPRSRELNIRLSYLTLFIINMHPKNLLDVSSDSPRKKPRLARFHGNTHTHTHWTQISESAPCYVLKHVKNTNVISSAVKPFTLLMHLFSLLSC